MEDKQQAHTSANTDSPAFRRLCIIRHINMHR